MLTAENHQQPQSQVIKLVAQSGKNLDLFPAPDDKHSSERSYAIKHLLFPAGFAVTLATSVVVAVLHDPTSFQNVIHGIEQLLQFFSSPHYVDPNHFVRR